MMCTTCGLVMKHNKWVKCDDGSQKLVCPGCGKIIARFNYLQALTKLREGMKNDLV